MVETVKYLSNDMIYMMYKPNMLGYQHIFDIGIIL